jgi:hypothetical protein
VGVDRTITRVRTFFVAAVGDRFSVLPASEISEF